MASETAAPTAEVASPAVAPAAGLEKPKITLHWLETSRAQRIVWLLQECKNVDYDIKVYKRVNMLAPPSLKEVHPLAKSPTITIDVPGGKRLTLVESGTMTEYLVKYFAQHLEPKQYEEGKEGQLGGETAEWLRYRLFMHYAEGSLMTILILALVIENIRSGPAVPVLARPITRLIAGKVYAMFLTKALNDHFSFLEEQLKTSPGGGKYLTGVNLTAADIMMSFPLISAKARSIFTAAKYPTLAAYTERIEQEPVYLQSIAVIEKVSGEKFQASM